MTRLPDHARYVKTALNGLGGSAAALHIRLAGSNSSNRAWAEPPAGGVPRVRGAVVGLTAGQRRHLNAGRAPHEQLGSRPRGEANTPGVGPWRDAAPLPAGGVKGGAVVQGLVLVDHQAADDEHLLPRP